MIMIHLMGGIGNQLFQYALYTALQKQGKRVWLDYTTIRGEMTQLCRETIFDVFMLDRPYSLDAMDGIAGKLQRRLFNRVFRKLAKSRYEKEDGVFDPEILQLKHGYLEGYWQSPKYFDGFEQVLRERLRFKRELNEENKQILCRIQSADCPVSVHIRLGDYTSAENSALFGNICTREYYERSIEYICEKHEGATFFVFSNEPRKAMEVIDIPNAVVVDINDESAAWADMYLMSQCHNNIIANSTFSWWGAWMNDYEDKEVIAPQKWINGKTTPDICPKSWIRM